MKDRLTIQEKIKAYKLFQQIDKGKEFRMEITYSDKYLQKVKTFLNYFPPRPKS